MNINELKTKIAESSLPKREIEFYLSYLKDELKECFDSEGELIETEAVRVFSFIDHYSHELNSELVHQNLYRYQLISDNIEHLGQKNYYLSLKNIIKHARETEIKSLKDLIKFKTNPNVHSTRSTQMEDLFLESAELDYKFSKLTRKQKIHLFELFEKSEEKPEV